MPSKPGILVLCTGNSARSQMAAAALEQHLAGERPVYSAGTEPAEEVHPLTRVVMAEVGVDLSDARPEPLDDYLGVIPIHTVIIVCDGANASCPRVWPGAYERLFWPFDDPAAAEGSSDERLAKFREVRDAVDRRVVEWVEERQAADNPA